MEIRWFGQSCFEINTPAGRIITDPYHDEVGWVLPQLSADILTISHNHYDHNNRERILAKNIFEGPGEYAIGSINIMGWETSHGKHNDRELGKNIIFKFILDGMNILHLGDLGVLLTETQIQSIGQVDILLVPVGGVYTLDAKGAKQAMDLLQPKIVIPMHYKISGLAETALAPVDNFISAVGIVPEYLNKLEITPKELEKPLRLVILNRVMQ